MRFALRIICAILKGLLITVALLWCRTAYSQRITGKVYDAESHEALSGAILIVRQGGKIVNYCTTDAKGQFHFDDVKPDSQLEARMMGYHEYIFKPDAGNLDILLKPEKIIIDEAVIKAPPVVSRGDTISYLIPALTNPADRSLQDVLKRIPGVQVSDKGYVQYNGKPINKFYIEGNDVLDSRYNLAIQNLSPESITTLQIFENHQPIKALEGMVRSESAALNIVLQDKVKGQWIAELELGGGYDANADIPLSTGGFLSRFSRKTQLMATAKYDQTGEDIIRNSEGFHPGEIVINLNDLDFLNRFQTNDYISPYSAAGFSINRQRDAFNRSLSTSVYSKVLLGANRSLILSADYEQELLNRRAQTNQWFFDKDGALQLVINDASTGLQTTMLPTFELRYSRNDNSVYVNEHLKIKNKNSFCQFGNEKTEPFDNNYSLKEFELLNSFNVVHRKSSNKVHTFSLLSQYTDKTEVLSIRERPNDNPYQQNVRIRQLYNRSDFLFSKQFSHSWTLEARTIVPLLIRELSSCLLKFSHFLPTDDLSNHLNLLSFKPTEDLRLQYRRGRFSFFLQELFEAQLLACSEGKNNKLFIASTTSVSGSYKISSLWKTEVSVSHDIGHVNEQEIYSAPIMQGYHRFTAETLDIHPQLSSFSGGALLSYQNPVYGTAFRTGVNVQHGQNWGGTRSFLENADYVWEQRSREKTPFSSFSSFLSLDKAIADYHHTLSLTLEASHYASSLIQNEIVTPYKTDRFSSLAKWSGNFSDRITTRLQTEASYMVISIDQIIPSKGRWNTSSYLSVVYIPIPAFQIESIIHSYWNNAAISNNLALFWDIHFDWTFRKFGIGLHFDNILNKTEYRSSLESPLYQIDHIQPLRPFSAMLLFSLSF